MRKVAMAQESRTVVREIPAGGTVNTDFVVEYMDSEGKWLDAAGGWKWGLACKSGYPDERVAGLVAEEISQTGGHRTRITKVVTRGH